MSNLSYFHKVGEEPLRPLTLGLLLEDAVKNHANKLAVISKHQNKRLTYAELLDQADHLAAGLMKIGFQIGDLVGLWAPNLIEWYVAYMACARGGFIMVAINSAYQPKEIENCINKVGVKGIICGHKFKFQNYYDSLKIIAPELGESEPGKLNSINLPYLKCIITIADEPLRGTYNYNEIIDLADTESIDVVRKHQGSIKIDDPCNILLSSGTTGQPKAVVISHFSDVNNGFYIGKRNGFHKKHHVICAQTPLFHALATLALISPSLNYGSTVVLPSSSYDPYKSLETLREEQCTVIYGTPTMYVDLIRVQREKKEKLFAELAFSAGALCPPHLFKEMVHVLGVKKVKSAYGLSECGGVFQSLCDEDDSVTTAACLHDHMEAKVVNADGKIVPIGTPGELCVRGYSIMLGYWKDEDKTKEAINRAKWLHTGDQFVMEENGYGRMVGRIKEMINRGGENIFPGEIEDLLMTHPSILEIYVIGLPHERLGEEVCACVRLKEGCTITLEEIKSFCKGNIAHFKIPSAMEIIDSFPRTASGKVHKLTLAENVQNSRRGMHKLSYFRSEGEEPLSPLTLGLLLEEAARKHANNLAIISRHQNKTITFSEALIQADRLAAGLMKIGFQVGDRIGVWIPNLIEWFVTYMACARGGFILVAINFAYQLREVDYCIKKVGLKGIIICGRSGKFSNYYDILKAIAPELTQSEPGKLNSINLPSLKYVITIADEPLSGTYSYNDILCLADADAINAIRKNQDRIRPDDPCIIQFSSGTTGQPKAIVNSHCGTVNNGFYFAKRIDFFKKHHKICVQVPFFHTFGTLVAICVSLHCGSTLVLPSESYDSEKNYNALNEEQCTVIYGTPTMYIDLIRIQKERKANLSAEIAVTGGALCSPHLLKEMVKVLGTKKIKSAYGLTESGVVFQSLHEEDEYEATSTVGCLLDHMEAKVVDASGKIVPVGTPGELYVRGYSTMLGYWEDEDATKETIGRDKWLRTGDQFIMEANGYGRVVGRLKEMINRGGESIFPKEVEDFLITHTSVLEVHVVGLPHERLGEEVCACIKFKEGCSITLEEIKNFCMGNIAYFKIPSVLKIVDSFPKTVSGKIQKFKLVANVNNDL